MSKYIKTFNWLIYVSLLVCCTTPQRGIFGKKTPHEKYTSSLQNAGLDDTQLGKQWLLAADKSLASPIRITVPYKETGYFEMNEPTAAGYLFDAKKGEQLTIAVNSNPANGFLLFIELWEAKLNDKPGLLSSADSSNRIQYEIKKDGEYIIRIQPELLQGAAYTVTVSTGPSLAFPVNKKDNPRVISLWGADRDAGARRHEGIDIQAKKSTPAIAPVDSYVSNVSENNLGGKVVFLRPRGKDYSLYYAHLDVQLVRSGQQINAGDTIGLIGNTGNARYTPAHLHFGIYSAGGAVDPFPFINTDRPPVKEVKADTGLITQYLRVKNNNTGLYNEPVLNTAPEITLPAGSLIKVIAAADNLYKVRLPGNEEGFIKSDLVTTRPLRQQKIPVAYSLLDMPDTTASVKKVLNEGSEVTLLGTYKEYYYTQWQNSYGWIIK